MQRGYENAPSISFIAWDSSLKPVRVSEIEAYRYFTIEGIKEAIKRGNVNDEDWRIHILTTTTHEVLA